MARNAFAKKRPEGATITFLFTDANQTHLTLDTASLSEEMRTRLAVHGAAQKIGDSYAGAKTVDEAIKSARGVIESLVSGEWGRERGESENASLLEAAYHAVMVEGIPGKLAPHPELTLDEARARLKSKSDEVKRELRKQPEIVAAIGRIQLERATAAAGTATPTEDLF